MELFVENYKKTEKTAVFDWQKIIETDSKRFILWFPFCFGIGAALGIGPLNDLELIIILKSIGILILVAIYLFFTNSQKHNFFKAITLNLFFLLTIIFCGLLAANLRTNIVSEPIIKIAKNYKINGKIINISKSFNGNWRAKIELFSLDDKQIDVPKYIKINIENIKPENIGNIINCNGFLLPPDMQIHPLAYDFAKDAWFEKIGAIGSCKNEIKYEKQNSKFDLQQYLEIKRAKIANEISNGKIGGGYGFLAAVSTGDRSYISKEEMEALQISGLGHIVSVSGLHVGLVAGVVFFLFKKLLSLFPFIALKFDTRKIAATISILFITYYTFFTGAEAPALRALIMASVMMIGIILNRKAISMRGLIVAAMILLAISPENALDSGFLMSFLATMALVSLWEYNEIKQFLKPKNPFEIVIFWLFGAALTSLVAGIATIPISLNNFQTLNTYGLIANLISAPISDFIVAPFAIIGFALKPFYIGQYFLDIAAWGLQIILNIGFYFASFQNSSFFLANFSALSASLMVFSLVWFCLFLSNLRLFAIFPFCLSIILWFFSPKIIAIFSLNSNAMINIAQAQNGNVKLCFTKGGKYDAKRLINFSPIPSQLKEAEINIIENYYSKNCTLYGGNWSAHFLKNEDTKNEYIISLTIEGKTYALSKEIMEKGAILFQSHWGTKLYIPKAKAKWQKIQIYNLKNINSGGIMKPEPLEP